MSYSTFEDCDRHYLDDLLQPSSLLPVWATPQDLSLATNLSIDTYGLSPAIRGYFMGTAPSPYQQPCTQTAITSVYSDTQSADLPTIIIDFNPSVEVTTHYFPEFQFLVIFQDLEDEPCWYGLPLALRKAHL